MGDGYSKREIVDAVMTALGPLGVQGGGYVRQMETAVRGEGPEYLAGAALRLPAVFVSFSASTYSPWQYTHVRETVGFEVTVVAMNGAGRNAEEVLADVRRILAGSGLGLNAGQVVPVRETMLPSDGHRVAYSALYTISQSVPVAG